MHGTLENLCLYPRYVLYTYSEKSMFSHKQENSLLFFLQPFLTLLVAILFLSLSPRTQIFIKIYTPVNVSRSN